MKLKRRFGVVLLMAMLVMAMTVTASAAKKVKLNKKSATLSIGKTVTLRVKNAGKKKVTWASSDVYVATVDDGVVTAVDAGTATIRATVGAKTLKCKVTVKAAAEQASVAIVGYSTFEPRLVLTGSLADATSIDPLQNTQALDVLRGKTQYDLKPHVQTTPAGAALTWTSSNEKVATVKDGVVKAVSDGTALITVSANGASDSIVAYVTGMGSDEETNPVVITMANYDRVFNKYFEKVTVRTVFLDVNGNILAPDSFSAAEVVVNGKTEDITKHVKKDFYEEKYYIVCKDSRVDTLKSSGSGNFLVWETVNDLAAKGGEPVLTETKRLGLVNPSTMYKQWVYDEDKKEYVEKWFNGGATELGVVEIPNAGNIPFTYYRYTYMPVEGADNVDYTSTMQKAAGLCKVTVSDPSVAGKAVLGFGPYGVSGSPVAKITYTPVQTIDIGGVKVKVRYIDKVSYTTNAYTGETFREINFVLYLK